MEVKVKDMMLDATFNNILVTSWPALLWVGETGKNHRPVASHWQTLSHNGVSNTPRLNGIQAYNVRGDNHRLHRQL